MTRLRALLAAPLFLLPACATVEDAALNAPPSRAVAIPQTQDPYFADAAAALAARAPQGRARNVILFIGDGMGVSTVTAARIYAGQRQGGDGESYDLAMDQAPHSAFSRTYSHDFQVADSAATATAMTTGVKTNSGVLGVASAARLGDCAAGQANSIPTLFELAEAQGLSTGIVSTARITHATPAAAYAHAAHRDWENDAVAAAGGAGACHDIARQLIEWPAGDGFEIALGGGRANFLPNTIADPEAPQIMGQRRDGRDLTAEWTAKSGHAYIWNAQQFAATDFSSDVRVLGLFSPSHMAYELQRGADPAGEPSLAEMTRAAITRLSQDREGYVLMIEAGRIDHAHHEGRAQLALADTVAMDEAIRTALAMTSREDTLIIATADHSHTLTIAGYARRNNPITGLSADEESPRPGALDGKPYTTLGYANGPGAVFAGEGPAARERPDLSGVDTSDPAFRVQALVPLASETHAGEDVPVYAWGPGAEAISGTIEQQLIFHAMAHALGFRFR
ncbi:MAG: alkaline phosphatase [Hydrogenophilaceae bacterium]|jgi:alkaline phosphatase|nr:alkaline phosphatase [Hydrogenophilaceae bacterium]